jgi:hypothetical protein
MLLFNSKNWTQENAVLSDLDEASPRRANKEKEREVHSIVLEISSKEKLRLYCLKL